MLRRNKKLTSLAILLLVVTLSLAGCTVVKEGVIATVNGKDITEEEFHSEFEIYKNQREKQFGENAMTQVLEDGRTREETLKQDIVESLIMINLVTQETEKMGIAVTEEDLEKELDATIEDFGSKEKFEETLESNGITEEYFKKNLKRILSVDKHKEELFNRMTVEDKEAQKFFEENREDLIVIKASHILVPKEEEAKDILARLKNGESFASLAIQESRDNVSAAKGGDLGYFSRGSRIYEFEEAAFALEKGEISELVKTEIGYHIIYIEDRLDNFEDLRTNIELKLKEAKYIEEIQNLREKAKVKIYLDI